MKPIFALPERELKQLGRQRHLVSTPNSLTIIFAVIGPSNFYEVGQRK